jgi:hypothetical protein
MSEITSDEIKPLLTKNKDVMEYGFDLIGEHIYDIGFKVIDKLLPQNDKYVSSETAHRIAKLILIKYLEHEFKYESENN